MEQAHVGTGVPDGPKIVGYGACRRTAYNAGAGLDGLNRLRPLVRGSREQSTHLYYNIKNF